MVVGTVTFTTYKTDGTTPSGTPFVTGFRDKGGNNNFDNTGNTIDADIEIPPPPPPGDGNGIPISTSYIDTIYVTVSDGSNDINAYQYFVDNSGNSDIALNLAVRDSNADNVVFKYNPQDVSGVFGTLAITNGTWTIDLVKHEITGTVTEVVPSISIDGEFRKVTIPHLGNDLFYTMNLKQYVADSGPTEVTQTIELTSVGYTWISTYINNEPINDIKIILLDPLENLEIISQTSQPIRYALSGIGANRSVKWSSTVVYPLYNTQMYIFKIPSAPFNINVTASSLANDTTISLVAGWNWISYPCSNAKLITNAITNPTENDSIISQTLSSNYKLSGIGANRGVKWSTIVTLNPGIGYKYYTSDVKQLVISST